MVGGQRKKRARKTAYTLNPEEEMTVLEFLKENPLLWDIKKIDYRNTAKKDRVWKEQAVTMEKSVEHLQGWFRSMRDTYTRLDKKRSGDGQPDLTERDQWIVDHFDFLKTTVRHRPEPVRSVSMKSLSFNITFQISLHFSHHNCMFIDIFVHVTHAIFPCSLLSGEGCYLGESGGLGGR